MSRLKRARLRRRTFSGRHDFHHCMRGCRIDSALGFNWAPLRTMKRHTLRFLHRSRTYNSVLFLPSLCTAYCTEYHAVYLGRKSTPTCCSCDMRHTTRPSPAQITADFFDFFSDGGKYCIRCCPADLLQHMHTVQVPTPTRTFVGLGTDSACTGSSIGSIN